MVIGTQSFEVFVKAVLVKQKYFDLDNVWI